MKNKLASHFQYRWWIYVVFTLVTVILWLAVFSAMGQYRANEKIAIVLFGGGEQLPYDLYDSIYGNLTEITSQEIREVTIEQPNDSLNLTSQLIAARTPVSDIFIIPEAMLKHKNEDGISPPAYFYSIPEEKLSAIFGEDISKIEFMRVSIEEHNLVYGVYLNYPDDSVTNNFEKIYSGEERYVAFFSFESQNLNKLYGVGAAGDSAAIDIINYLLSYN